MAWLLNIQMTSLPVIMAVELGTFAFTVISSLGLAWVTKWLLDRIWPNWWRHL